MSELLGKKGNKKKPLKPAGHPISFEAGTLSGEEIEAIFNTLPVDITFVDKQDTVRYFNKGEERQICSYPLFSPPQ